MQDNHHLILPSHYSKDDFDVSKEEKSWKNLDPETGVHWDADEADWDKIRDNWPAYDKAITPTNTMGAVSEMFRSWPGAISELKLMKQRELVDFAVEWIEKNRI